MRWVTVGVLAGMWLSACLELSSTESDASGGQAGNGGSNVGGSGGWPSGGNAGDGSSDTDLGGAGGAAGGASTTCTTDKDCTTGFYCAPLAHFASAATGSMCTRSCCSSDECSTDSVCFPTGKGYSACAPTSLVGRTTPGAAASGASCSTDADCRSAQCVSGRCHDTCCADADCASDDACTLSTVPGEQHKAFSCAHPPGGSDAFGSCATVLDCKSGLCTGNGYCVPPCCNSATCVGQAKICGYAKIGGSTSVVRTCLEVTPGTKADGAACTSPSECAGGYCQQATLTCASACCTDADCSDPTKLACRVQPLMTGGSALLCVPR